MPRHTSRAKRVLQKIEQIRKCSKLVKELQDASRNPKRHLKKILKGRISRTRMGNS